ncbi:MAG: excinuclease ATPase subunit [Porticoccaceae bacterium]
MRHFICIAVAILALFSLNTHARDTKHLLSIDNAMKSPAYEEKLNAGIRFFFGDTAYPEPSRRFGDYVSNKKTNAVGKSDLKACEWVLLSALISLQERAVAEGGNAVVNIRSYYKKNEFSSDTEYECHAGAVMAGVALIGEVVRLPDNL